MNEKDTKNKVSTRVLYIWSVVLLVLGFAPLFIIRYQRSRTSCYQGGCTGLNSAADVLQPLGALVFVAGLALLVSATVLLIARRSRRTAE